jgi:hypothetical protein
MLAGTLLLLPAFVLAPAQTHPSSGHETHQYNLADAALAIWHKGPKGWQLAFTQVPLADHP